MNNDLLFVYGTLRQGFHNPVRIMMEEYAVFLGRAVMQGKLFEINHYPGAVLSDNPDDLVQGEVYMIRDRKKLFTILDEYEESADGYPAPREYIREKVSIILDNDEGVSAYTYLYNHETAGRRRIYSGDYLKYRQEKDGKTEERKNGGTE